MAFCKNCGHKLADGAKFCENCGTAAGENDNTKRKAVYEGEVRKCPNCGEVLGALTAICPVCRYELRGTKTSTTIQKLVDDLSRARRDTEKANIITNFVIPSTKEDIIEFMLLASSNLDSYSSSSVQKKSYLAWTSKIKICYDKAKIIFGNDPEFQSVQATYDIYRKKARKRWILAGAIAVAGIIYLMVMLTMSR